MDSCGGSICLSGTHNTLFRQNHYNRPPVGVQMFSMQPLVAIANWSGRTCLKKYNCCVPLWSTEPMWLAVLKTHYSDVIMGAMAFQITGLTIVYSTVYSDADQRKHHSSASLAFEFPAQMASKAENASTWWRHHLYTEFTHVKYNMHLLVAIITTCMYCIKYCFMVIVPCKRASYKNHIAH